MGWYKEPDRAVIIHRMQQYYNRVKLVCWDKGIRINRASCKDVDKLLKDKRFRQPKRAGKGFARTQEDYDNA